MTLKYYVGYAYYTGRPSVFRSVETPQQGESLFASVTGPFRTKRGADFMAKHGRNNPHCRSVAEAEHCARRAASETTQ